MDMISEDAKAILLLCGRFGGNSDVGALDQREYNQVVRWLMEQQLRPSDLLLPEHVTPLAQGSGIPEDRLQALLKRGVKLGFAVEGWNQSGIWVVCRSDPEYPARYKSHLKDKAPPILYCAGKRSLLQGGGLAIVGSRNVDISGEDYTRNVAAWCARGGMPVVSGSARGVDQVAMASALESGGVVIGVLADTLLRKSVAREARNAIADGQLLLLSPYHPDAGFNVGNAMGRNKLIYALADYGLVVSADHNSGGTWEGAAEELKRKPGRPVFVRLGENVPVGNRKLIDLGAVVFPRYSGSPDPVALLQEAAAGRVVPEPQDETPLFTQTANVTEKPLMVRESAETVVDGKDEKESKPEQLLPPVVVEPPVQVVAQPLSVFEAVKPLIVQALDKPRSLMDLAKILKVRKPQLEDWVKVLIQDGVLEEVLKRKVKKLAVRNPAEELKL